MAKAGSDKNHKWIPDSGGDGDEEAQFCNFKHASPQAAAEW